MGLSPEERERFLGSLRTDEEFRESVRRELLTAELLDLPQRFAAFVEEVRSFIKLTEAFVQRTEAFMEATNARLASVDARFDRVDARLEVLEKDVGELKGMGLETKLRGNPGHYLHTHVKRAEVVSLDDLIDDLGLQGLADSDYDTLARADLFVRGVSRQDGSPLVVVIEATWEPHTRDVGRQVARRDILSRRGEPVLAAVVAIEPAAPSVAELARAGGVLLLTERAAEAA